jgi:type I restriction-modification system DNA methylase subunit
MDAAEYKHVVLGLIFLKYISDAFEAKHAELEAQRKHGADPEDPDEFRAASIFWVPKEADYVLANPRYGKSWKKDLQAMGGKDGMRDPRFKVMHQGEELSLVTRSSDGRMLFLETTVQRVPARGGSGYARHRSPQVPTGA